MTTSVMDYDVETVLVDALEQDRQVCYNAVRITGSGHTGYFSEAIFYPTHPLRT